MDLLAGLHVVSTGLNLPGPVACARLRELGASITKVEPPEGDPLERYSPGWYGRLNQGVEVRRLDLKSEADRATMATLLGAADLLVTAQRPSALARLGLDAPALARFPRLCHVAIVGHAAPREESPGHDLTYLAEHGLVRPPALPATLFADMAGAERVVSTALALVIARERDGRSHAATSALADAAAFLAQPLAEGLTRGGGLLGGRSPSYNLYAAKDGWIAVAALERHFEQRLARLLGLEALSVAALREHFAREQVAHWEALAREHDLPIVAVRSLS